MTEYRIVVDNLSDKEFKLLNFLGENNIVYYVFDKSLMEDDL